MKSPEEWFKSLNWKPFSFQTEAWEAYAHGQSGMVNAPTGSGKTYSLIPPILIHGDQSKSRGVRCIWITPIRALSKEIEMATQRAITGMGSDWTVGVRTGDTSASEKTKQNKVLPEILITTPESLHILLGMKGSEQRFKHLECVVVDEWHELLGSKRAVQMELALSRLKGMIPHLRTWGISATIGNMEEAIMILLGSDVDKPWTWIRSDLEKKIEVKTVLPDSLDALPWAGHLGIRLIEKVIPLIHQSTSTLIFTNTRSQAEIWYQRLIEAAPELIGQIAMHHGSIDRQLRFWVEDALHEGRIKAVVCTSSLDLGVDFRPVETIVQIGSPKGVARFMQRAGRSGHAPGETSRIWFVPTHALEILEAGALREAIEIGAVEHRMPYLQSYDVLVQYLVTLAVGDGFYPDQIRREVSGTTSFYNLTDEEWHWCLTYITKGGPSLEHYDEFQRVEIEEGKYIVKSRKVAMRHRLSIGTIVSDVMVKVRLKRGGYLGHIEEYFIARLKPGDSFWFAGQQLELIKFKGLEAEVQRSNAKTSIVPSWQGGRMPLSAELGKLLRKQLELAGQFNKSSEELHLIAPIIALQKTDSMVPKENELLIERMEDEEGHHLFIYPFEGRLVHEGLANLIAWRISKIKPISFSIAMNDYGFQLLSDQPIPIEHALESDVFTAQNLYSDLQVSVNETELAKRRFRDIAHISGLVFGGFPGKPVKDKHIQSNAQLFFKVFEDYEPDNLLLIQAHQEVHDFQLEEARMRLALERIAEQEITIVDIERPTPLAFPILVDRLREKLSSEDLNVRIRKMLGLA